MKRDSLPISLIIVAVLFIMMGVDAAFGIRTALAHHRMSFNICVLGLFIGPGLLFRARGWRVCALALTWIILICIPIVPLLMLLTNGSLHIRVLGPNLGLNPGQISYRLFGLALVGAFAVAGWMYYVLTRPDVRRLFHVSKP